MQTRDTGIVTSYSPYSIVHARANWHKNDINSHEYRFPAPRHSRRSTKEIKLRGHAVIAPLQGLTGVQLTAASCDYLQRI